jgi:hypothetical protein
MWPKAVLLAALLFAPPAFADWIFHWWGDCTLNCEGKAHAALTVDSSYVLGTRFNCDWQEPCILKHAYYTDSGGSWEATDRVLGASFGGWGQFDADDGELRIGLYNGHAHDVPLWSRADGTWLAFGTDDSRFDEYGAIGTGGRFSIFTVPEPGTLALILSACLALLFRRKPKWNGY